MTYIQGFIYLPVEQKQAEKSLLSNFTAAVRMHEEHPENPLVLT